MNGLLKDINAVAVWPKTQNLKPSEKKKTPSDINRTSSKLHIRGIYVDPLVGRSQAENSIASMTH